MPPSERSESGADGAAATCEAIPMDTEDNDTTNERRGKRRREEPPEIAQKEENNIENNTSIKQPSPPLKPEVIREAYEKALLRIRVRNKSNYPINVTCQLGNAWDWEIIPVDATHDFPTYLNEPLIAGTVATNVSVNYCEACIKATVENAYDIVTTQAAKGTASFAFEFVVQGPGPTPKYLPLPKMKGDKRSEETQKKEETEVSDSKKNATESSSEQRLNVDPGKQEEKNANPTATIRATTITAAENATEETVPMTSAETSAATQITKILINADVKPCENNTPRPEIEEKNNDMATDSQPEPPNGPHRLVSEATPEAIKTEDESNVQHGLANGANASDSKTPEPMDLEEDDVAKNNSKSESVDMDQS